MFIFLMTSLVWSNKYIRAS